MQSVKVKPPTGSRLAGFRHEALLYDDRDEYLQTTLAFVREGLEASEPVLVAVAAANAALLEGELGADRSAVRFTDVEAVGRNPARLIPLWRGFLDRHGAPARGIGEPIWPGRRRAEVDECQLHEGLLNVAFASQVGWSVLCPYDASRLDDAVLESATRSHDALLRHGVREPNAEYGPLADGFAGELKKRPSGVAGFEFERTDLAEVRRRVEESAEAVGIASLDVAALVVAASELAANSVAHGGGRGMLWIWTEPGRLVVEVQDGGQIEEPLVGRVRPSKTQQGGRGLWMANQLCDLVQIRSGEDGTVVRLQATRP